MDDFPTLLKECPLVPILRGIRPQEVLEVGEILYNSGIRLLEIPLNSPDAFSSIQLAAQGFGGRMLIGAGTVLSSEDVKRVRDLNVAFIVSPNVNSEVIQETKRLGLVSIPGFFTATEALSAIRAGADYLKLFPAMPGPRYIKDLKAVLTKPILAFGGINQNNLVEFLQVCDGVGIGNAIFTPEMTQDEIRHAACTLIDLWRNSL